MDNLLVLGEQLGLSFRWSNVGDEEKVNGLIKERFGNRDKFNVTENIKERYFMAIDADGEVVAITGLGDFGDYAGLEVDWTCVDKRYTGYNLVSLMLEYLLKDCKVDVYCSCWRLSCHPINLLHAMQYNRFCPVLVPRITYDSEYNADCDREHCVNYNPMYGSCRCYEDLYCRKAKVR